MSKIKSICLFFILLIEVININAQSFADKDYYLVDSLNLNTLDSLDLILIESSIKAYYSSDNDTSRINSINRIVEQSWNNDLWPKYNLWVFHFVENILKNTHPPTLTKKYKIYLTDAINNIGYLYDVQGKK